MPPRRVRSPERPTPILLDGAEVAADADASVASALVGAGHWVLARSPKFHRPRGPSCLRGGCDGCLMRVDGVPNVMTCGIAPKLGMKVERQNVILSASMDVLRATDWFFPHGMNHHELLAGVPGVQSVMLAFARRVSGLGELPQKPVDPRSAGVTKIGSDVLVVGGGPSGLCAAIALARSGKSVVVVDEGVEPGGSLSSFPRGARAKLGERTHDVDALRAELIESARAAGVSFRSSTTLLGVLEGADWLADDAREGLVRFEAKARVVATGGHDGVASFVGNDLPGVISARAAGRLLRDGVLVGERLVVAGNTVFCEVFAEHAAREGAHVQRVALESIEGVRGMSSVRTVVVRDGREEKKLDADALVIGVPVAPAFEIAASSGAPVEHVRDGYRVVVDEGSRARGGARAVFAVGEVIGGALDLEAMRAAATLVQREIEGGAS